MTFEISDVMFTDLQKLEAPVSYTWCKQPTCVCLDSSRYMTKVDQVAL